MSNLKSYREKYPTLTQDLSDDEIIQNLHESYYETQDFDTFKDTMLSTNPLPTREEIEVEEEKVESVITPNKEEEVSKEESVFQDSAKDSFLKSLSTLSTPVKLLNLFTSEPTERVFMGAASDVGQETLQLVNGIADYTGIYDFDGELHDKQQEVIKTILTNLVGEEDIETKQRGNKEVISVAEPESFGGQITRDLTAVIGSIFAGTKGVGLLTSASAKTKKGAELLKQLEGREKTLKALKFGKYSAGAELGIQMSIDPYEARFANMIGENIQDDDSALAAIVDFLEADPNDTELEARTGLFLESLALNLALPAAWYGGKKVVDKAKNSETLLNSLKTIRGKGSEAVEDFKKVLTDTSKNSGEKAPKVKGVRGKIGEDASKEWQFAPEAWKRWFATVGLNKLAIGGKELFKSRGYFTPKMFDMFRSTEANKAAWLQRSEDLASKLDRKITSIAEKSNRFKNREQLADLVQTAFTAKNKRKALKALPAALRKDVEYARDLVDSYSEMLLEMPNRTISKVAKESIEQNMGQWFRRSYRLFEEGNWKPSDEIVSNAEKYLYNYYRKNFKKYSPDKISPEQLKGIVKAEIKNIVDSGSGASASDLVARTDAVGRLNKTLLSKKGDLAKPIRELLGEIKDPSANLMISLNRITSFVENNEFLENAYQLGRGKTNKQGEVVGGYIFEKPTIDPRTGIEYRTKLEDPNLGILNGKFVTDATAAMFNQRKGFANKILESEGYRWFLGAKGYGQAAKTVFNHITHLRNTLGGVFFTLANGRMPLGTEGKEAYKVLKNKILDQGDEAGQAYYQKLRRLDIVDNSARFGDIKALMNEADLGVEAWLDKSATKLGWEKGKAKGKKAIEKVQEVYIAEDDFFKIMNFEKELDTLTKAYKTELKNGTKTINQLEEEAASIIRRTIPNYSLVPTGIKELRKLPIGNYFSFPAEMIRTSYHIAGQAFKESMSANTAIRNRGIQRIAGFSAVGMGGSKGLSELSKLFSNVTDEEAEALRYLSPFEYQKNSEMLYYRNDEGKLFVNDFSYVDPYDYVKRPFVTLFNEYRSNQRTQEDFNEALFRATGTAVAEMLRPFYSESLLTERVVDIAFRQGKTAEGYMIPNWNPEPNSLEEFGENASTVVLHLLQTFVPGSAASIPKLLKATTGEEDDLLNIITGARPGDRDYNLKAEILANFTGVRFTEVDINKQLEQQARKFKSRESNITTKFKRKSTGPSKNSTDFINAYRDANERKYKDWKDLALAYEAADTLGLNPLAIERPLNKSGISSSDLQFIRLNKFKPFEPSEERFDAYESKSITDIPRNVLEAEIGKYHYMYLSMPIIDFDRKKVGTLGVELLEDQTSMEEIEEKRKGFAAGTKNPIEVPNVFEQEVNVEKATTDSKERINPFTNRPYTDIYKRNVS